MKKVFRFLSLGLASLVAPLTHGEMVVISEIMYHAPAGKPDYIEVYNHTLTPFDIAGWTLTGGVEFHFSPFDRNNPSASFLNAFERIVFSSADETSTRAAYPIPANIRVFGPWRGNLSQKGERLALQDKNGVPLCSVTYQDRGLWSPAADGAGHSLVLKNPDRAVDDWRNWGVSAQAGGTPGTDGAPAVMQALRLNEVSFTSSNTVGWVEFYNASPNSLPLDPYFLSSRRDFSDKVQLTGLISSQNFFTINVAFPLLENEITFYLLDAASNVIDARICPVPEGEGTWQNFPDGTGEWYFSPTATRDGRNLAARFTDIIINEIMSDPPSGGLEAEFIELYNRGSNGVEISGWRLDAGVEFTIPSPTILEAGGYLVVAANAERLRAVYGDIPVVGNWRGKLANRRDLIRLIDASGNLADEVDYKVNGDWPDSVTGGGSSLELVNPWMDNSLPSAWRGSDETGKAPWKQYFFNGTYRQLNSLAGASDYKELFFHLVGDGHLVLRNIELAKVSGGPNFILNGGRVSTNNLSSSGWLCQGNHAASFIDADGLHLISDGHGDNRPNRVEIDVPGITLNDNCRLSFEARWVSGGSRLIAQTWDHSIAKSFQIETPAGLGTPGQENSRYFSAPVAQIDGLSHSPAVPRAGDNVRITARVLLPTLSSTVEVWHRRDNINGNAAWAAKRMFDDGVNGGDALGGDGVYSAQLTEHKVNAAVVQFYVKAQMPDGPPVFLPKGGGGRPALYVVDNRSVPRDMRVCRFIVSAYDLDAINNGNTPKFGYKFPRLANHYKNMTFISNEKEIFYNGEIHNAGSPWTREGGMDRAKWKLPKDRLFRGHHKFSYDNEIANGTISHNRVVRHWLYLLGEPVNENEFVRVMINGSNFELREETEPVADDMLDRAFPDGSLGDLYQIEDEFWFTDSWDRRNHDADWQYKNTDNSGMYRTAWMKRSNEQADDFSALINFFKTVSGNYTQADIERLIDPESCLRYAAVRGYVSDWDNFTENRGKNGFFYRRPTDGRFQFLHWDSDLTFGDANMALWGNLPRFGTWINKPYNKRLFFAYLTELLDDYTKDSARMSAWFSAEENASTAFRANAAFYQDWYKKRLKVCTNALGINARKTFEITNLPESLATPEEFFTLKGSAPYGVFQVGIEEYPEARLAWTTDTAWTLSGIQMRQGQNRLAVRGMNQWGQILQTTNITVTKISRARPIIHIEPSPESWILSGTESLALDGGASRDLQGDPLNLEWEVAAPGATLIKGEFGQATATFNRPGLYPVTLRAIDTRGQIAEATREASVYGPDGLSSFDQRTLEPFWGLENVEYRSNYSPNSWLSLSEQEGKLVMQIPDDVSRPLVFPGTTCPFIWRRLPPLTDWAFATTLHLSGRQFGNFITGLFIETDHPGFTQRHAFGIENGNSLTVKQILPDKPAATLISIPIASAAVTLRARRAGGTLFFERQSDGIWNIVGSSLIGSDVPCLKSALFVSTSQPQAIQTSFDYALLIDPSLTSDLQNDLRITELMYNPLGGEFYEYVEVTNLGTNSLDLKGVRFTAGISFAFGSEFLRPGQSLAVVKDHNAFAQRYGTLAGRVAEGAFSGKLDNSGERLTLTGPANHPIQSFIYRSSADDWPARPDGFGSSLEAIDPRSDLNDPQMWRSSQEFLGSPGSSSGPPTNSIVINEILARASEPGENAIELSNLTSTDLDIGGWFLTDDLAFPQKFRIQNRTTISAGGYEVFYESDFFSDNPLLPFTLNGNKGGELTLLSAEQAGNIMAFVDAVKYGPSEPGISMGRFPNASGSMVALSRPTLIDHVTSGRGASNAYPKVGPVVIAQIMYHPIHGQMPFIELRNITSNDVSLYDQADPAHTWRLAGLAEYTLPPQTILRPAESLYLAGGQPISFRAHFNLPPSAQVVGPYRGSLEEKGGNLELWKPIPAEEKDLESPFVTYVLVDKVNYGSRPPWPIGPAGSGPGLGRIVLTQYGDDPQNWRMEPGFSEGDSDSDGIPEWWELAHDLEYANPNDALLDGDKDARTNLEEYLTRTDPWDPGSVFQIDAAFFRADSLVLLFTAQAEARYIIQYRDGLTGAPWTNLTNTAPQAMTKQMEVVDRVSARTSVRYYRLVVP